MYMRRKKHKPLPLAKKPQLWKYAELLGLNRSEIGEKISNAALREKIYREIKRREEKALEQHRSAMRLYAMPGR